MNDDPEDIDKTEKELENEPQQKKKVRSTDYSKIATAVNRMIKHGIKIVPPDINKSSFNFKPNAANNEIVYSFKAIDRIGDNLIADIVKYQPYTSIDDFISKVKTNRVQMINLIKAGCFDSITTLSKRKLLYNYIASFSELKNNLTLTSVPILLSLNLLPQNELKEQLAQYAFNKSFRKKQSKDNKDIYIVDTDDEKSIDSKLIHTENGRKFVYRKEWQKVYTQQMEPLKNYIIQHKDELLQKINDVIVGNNLVKYAAGSDSNWEMNAISFYYSGHELSNINAAMYDIVDFSSLPLEPELALITQWKGQTYPIYKLHTIAGTVIGKNKLRHTIALLTTKEVIYVKFPADLFAYYDKQLSEKDPLTTKRKVVEKSWFQRGSKLLITGVRQGENNFKPKVYKQTPIKMLYLITKIRKDGTLELRSERMNVD